MPETSEVLEKPYPTLQFFTLPYQPAFYQATKQNSSESDCLKNNPSLDYLSVAKEKRAFLCPSGKQANAHIHILRVPF